MSGQGGENRGATGDWGPERKEQKGGRDWRNIRGTVSCNQTF